MKKPFLNTQKRLKQVHPNQIEKNHMLYNVKLFLKKFWGWIVAACAAIFGALFFFKSREKDSESKALKDIIDAHDDEVKKISTAVEDEHAKLAENEKQYKEAMSAIQDQYTEANEKLDKKKKEQISQLVKDYKNNPKELAQKLSEVTGFKVILPEE